MRFEEAFKDLAASYGYLPPDEAKDACAAADDLRRQIVIVVQRGHDLLAAPSGKDGAARARFQNALDRLDLDKRTLTLGKGKPRKARIVRVAR